MPSVVSDAVRRRTLPLRGVARRRRRPLLVLASAICLLGACGPAQTGRAPADGANMTGHAMGGSAGSMGMSMTPGSGDHMGMSGGSGATTAAEHGHGGGRDFAFGEPGVAADASQTIDIISRDDLQFEPAAIEVPVGKTVVLRVRNGGTLAHEFVLGDEALQREHAAEMAHMHAEGGTMPDEAHAVSLAPGETKDVVWKFTVPGEFVYACHTPGHLEAGMTGRLSVK